ncbi:hypothetical protein BDZ97DRAFT_1751608 [Flammula alnicola]|nr:hypothetical protein BDZ97DRAFT_1751608 [Flammula alnicola]
MTTTSASNEFIWPDAWAAAIVAEPFTPELISSRLSDLLDGKTVGGAPGVTKGEKPKYMLEAFVQNADWTFKPEAFDAIWHAVFKAASKLKCTEAIRDATYYWTEKFLLNEALDAIPAEEGDEDEDLLQDGYDNAWIAAAVGDARLYALGYGYSAFAWNALLDGLGLGGEEANSDSMRIGSCGQLLAAGQRLKLHIHGGGDSHRTPGFAGRYLQAVAMEEGEATWVNVLKALEEEQEKAGPRAAALLKRTREHLESNSKNLTSVEVSNIIWPKAQE